MGETKGIMLYFNYSGALKKLSAEELKALVFALLDYGENSVEPSFSAEHSRAEMLFEVMRGGIDSDREKYFKTCERNKSNASKGNKKPVAPSGSQSHPVAPSGSQSLLNKNINKNKNINNNIYSPVVNYLNEKAGTKYKASSDKTRTLIHAREADGYSLDDFKKVIDNKCAEWLGTDYEKYLRPSTLFGTKFEEYLNAKPKQKDESPFNDFKIGGLRL